MGVVERIEYDPNHSSRVALVRWIEGVRPDAQRKCVQGFNPSQPKSAESYRSWPIPVGMLWDMGVAGKEAGNKLSRAKDVFVSAFSSLKPKEKSLHNIPRFAVAGSMPAVFGSQERKLVEEGEKTHSLSDVRRWRKDSVLWEHRLKCKASGTRTSFVREEPVGLALAADSKAMKGKSPKRGVNEHCAPLTYILASNEMEARRVIMTCDLSNVPVGKFWKCSLW